MTGAMVAFSADPLRTLILLLLLSCVLFFELISLSARSNSGNTCFNVFFPFSPVYVSLTS